MVDKDLFAKRLRYSMDKAGMRQSDLADKTGINRATINEYVQGKYLPKRKNMETIAEALYLQVSDLIGDTSDDPNMPKNTVLTELSAYVNSYMKEMVAKSKIEPKDLHPQTIMPQAIQKQSRTIFDLVFENDPETMSKISNVTTKGEFIYEDAVRTLTPQQIKILHDGFKQLIDEAVVKGQTEIHIDVKGGGVK